MYAVIKTGGKQYKVAAGHLIAVEKLAGTSGDTVAFDEVLLVGGDNDTTIGAPLVAGAAVTGEIVDHSRDKKILVFKKRRRQNSKRSRGHRQEHTLVRITEILTDGKKPTAKKAKTKEAPAPEAADATPAAAATAEAEAPAKPKSATSKKADAGGEAEKAKPARKPRAKTAKTEDKE